MAEDKDRHSGDGVVELFLGVTESFRSGGTISVSDDEHIKIGVIDDSSDNCPLFFGLGRKPLHACGNTSHLKKRLKSRTPFIDKVRVRGTYKYLISLAHKNRAYRILWAVSSGGTIRKKKGGAEAPPLSNVLFTPSRPSYP